MAVDPHFELRNHHEIDGFDRLDPLQDPALSSTSSFITSIATITGAAVQTATTTILSASPTHPGQKGNHCNKQCRYQQQQYHPNGYNDLSATGKWRIPTILVVTLAVALGSALAVFLAIVAYRRVKNLRQMRREMEQLRT